MRDRSSSLWIGICCVLVFSAVVVEGLVCGQKECPGGDVCCQDGVMGPTCFNPNTHDCVQERRLCGEGLGVCGTACYDKGMYGCWSNSTLCPHKMQACGSGDSVSQGSCYDPAKFRCIQHDGGVDILISIELGDCGGVGYNASTNECNSGDIVDIPPKTNCSVGQLSCGTTTTQCYDPQMYDCINGALKALPGVCGVGLLWCSTSCYDPSQYNCVAGELQPSDNITYSCPAGQLSCGQHCFNSTIHECFDGHMLCSVGMKPCGPACYSEDRYECVNGTLFGRPGYCSPQYSLCGSRCYSPAQYDCVRDILIPITAGVTCADNKCPIADLCCSDMILGAVCYNPFTHSCVDSNRLCGHGLKACNSVCYDHHLYDCIDGKQLVKNRLCPSNFSVCGNGQCYDASEFMCVASVILCPVGSPVCGSICYSKIAYMCVDGNLVPRISNDTSSNESSSDSSSSEESSGDNSSGDNSSGSGSDSSGSDSSSSDMSSDSSSSDSSSSDSSSDETVECMTGQQKCKNICFSPDTHACVNGVVVIICSMDQELCGNTHCFDPNTHNCTDGFIYPRIQCDDDEKICGLVGSLAVCYNPDHWKCVNGTVAPLVVCEANEKLCGSSCYDVDVSDCIDSLIVAKNLTCVEGLLRCGNNNRCFDPKLYLCTDGVLTCLNACGDQCFDIDVSACVAGKIVPYLSCAAGHLRCGPARNGLCYSPDMFNCVNNTLHCLEGMDMCSGVCFDSNVSVCIGGGVVSIHTSGVASLGWNVMLLAAALLAALFNYM